MNGVEKRLVRLKALHTELRSLGLEGAAEEVEEEIASLGLVPSEVDNPAVAEFLGAAMELGLTLEKGLNEIGPAKLGGR